MPKNCWCYTTDKNYLLPTIVSAMQARRFLKRSGDRVVIYYFGEIERVVGETQKLLSAHDVQIDVFPPSVLEGLPMLCARFYIDSHVDPQFSNIVYLDGDTQILSDLTPLSDAAPKSGGLLAAPDLMSFMANDTSKGWRDRAGYFQTIGISHTNQHRYFNSGVIKVGLNDWRDISKECLILLKRADATQFLFKDQDALNIVMAGGHELLSLKWNWPAFFYKRGLEDIVSPKIVHFMSKPRPWEGNFSPWGAVGHAPYTELLRTNPQLAELARPLRNTIKVRYHLQQFAKMLLEDWGSLEMRDKIMRAEQLSVA